MVNTIGDDLDDEDESDADEKLGTEKDTPLNVTADVAMQEAKIKDEAPDDDAEILTSAPTQKKPRLSNGSALNANAGLKTKAQIASLRADAMRLRQEAARREAEAYELEARMLRAEAKEADSPYIKIEP